jgi:hypothetical protein
LFHGLCRQLLSFWWVMFKLLNCLVAWLVAWFLCGLVISVLSWFVGCTAGLPTASWWVTATVMTSHFSNCRLLYVELAHYIYCSCKSMKRRYVFKGLSWQSGKILPVSVIGTWTVTHNSFRSIGPTSQYLCNIFCGSVIRIFRIIFCLSGKMQLLACLTKIFYKNVTPFLQFHIKICRVYTFF